MATFLRRCQLSETRLPDHDYTASGSTLTELTERREHLPGIVVDHIDIGMSEHVQRAQKILVLILLARFIQMVDPKIPFNTPGWFENPISLAICRVSARVVLQCCIDVDDNLLWNSQIRAPPVPKSEGLQSAKDATVPGTGTSICLVEIAENFWNVQQALQYGVAIALHSWIEESLGFGVLTPQRSSGSYSGPAFANSPVYHTRLSLLLCSALCF